MVEATDATEAVEILVRCAAGLDLHKKTVVVSVHTPEFKETRTFGTMTREIQAMAEWLAGLRVTHVAMEGTGVYWKPVYIVLEKYDFELHVYNAKQVKNAPGRKTDPEDSRWICKILRLGLAQPGFIPDKEQRERRELVTYRKSLIRERSSEACRIQKVLEGANIKLAGRHRHHGSIGATDLAGDGH